MKLQIACVIGTLLITSGGLFNTGQENEECVPIYLKYDEAPSLKKGYDEAIAQRLQYPELARKARIEGRVYLQYNVNKRGKYYKHMCCLF